jgi:hypothetical protein
VEFESFGKIARLSRQVVITEKIDGTNAQVCVGEDGTISAGSRTRWITPEDDNFGFAAWVKEHEGELRALGPGRHFGEWWGRGIQRGYGLTERRFSLFNVSRWTAETPPPACCSVVPVLWEGLFDTGVVDRVLADLKDTGSYAAYSAKAEGIMIYHTAARIYFKKTLDKDAEPKSKV